MAHGSKVFDNEADDYEPNSFRRRVKPTRAKANGHDPGARQPRKRVNLHTLTVWLAKAWDRAILFNELAHSVEVLTSFPQPAGGDTWRALADPADCLKALKWIQQSGLPGATRDVVWDAIRWFAFQHPHHPLRSYFAGLPAWDQWPRVGLLFTQYFKAKPPESDNEAAYLREIATCFMVGAVNRAMEPGCKVDHVPVAIGDQGILKSTGIAALCPNPDWFTDNISPNLIERDTKESLRGKWLIELAEMPHIAREVERVKVFISTQTDRYRASFGKANQDYPRQCVFFGTTNKLEFIDPTGNRRFWPFECSGLDVDAISQDRDQLWAEAFALYNAKRQWWLSPETEQIAKDIQARYLQADQWDTIISSWAAARSEFTMNDLFNDTGLGLGGSDKRATRADEMRAATRLQMLGFKQERRTLNGKRAWWWAARPARPARPPLREYQK